MQAVHTSPFLSCFRNIMPPELWHESIKRGTLIWENGIRREVVDHPFMNRPTRLAVSFTRRLFEACTVCLVMESMLLLSSVKVQAIQVNTPVIPHLSTTFKAGLHTISSRKWYTRRPTSPYTSLFAAPKGLKEFPTLVRFRKIDNGPQKPLHPVGYAQCRYIMPKRVRQYGYFW